MASLSSELRREGLTRTDKESPFAEDAYLWEDDHEVICGETGIVIRGGESVDTIDSLNTDNTVAELSNDVPTYKHSNKVILPGANKGQNFFYDTT